MKGGKYYFSNNTRSSWENDIAKKILSCKMLCFRITWRQITV